MSCLALLPLLLACGADDDVPPPAPEPAVEVALAPVEMQGQLCIPIHPLGLMADQMGVRALTHTPGRLGEPVDEGLRMVPVGAALPALGSLPHEVPFVVEGTDPQWPRVPAELEGAALMVSLDGAEPELVAFGEAGAANVRAFRERYPSADEAVVGTAVEEDCAGTPCPDGATAHLVLVGLATADVDGDGSADGLAAVRVERRDTAGEVLAHAEEVGVLWGSGGLVRLGFGPAQRHFPALIGVPASVDEGGPLVILVEDCCSGVAMRPYKLREGKAIDLGWTEGRDIDRLCLIPGRAEHQSRILVVQAGPP